MEARDEVAPSGSQVKADLDILQGTATKLVSDYESLQQAITTLQNESNTHAASWSGEAKNAWNTAMENVNVAWNSLNTVLDEIASNINTSGATYSDTDSTNATNLNKVPSTDISAALNR